MYSITRATELACAIVAVSASVSQSLECNIYTGFDDETKESPAVICTAFEAFEDFPQSGIWHVNAEITVKETVDTSLTSSLADKIFERFCTLDTASLASGSLMSAYGIFINGNSNTVDGDTYIQSLQLEIVGALI